MCSHLRVGDATAEKITTQKKHHKKLNVLTFLQQSTSLSCRLCEGGYTCNFHCVMAM